MSAETLSAHGLVLRVRDGSASRVILNIPSLHLPRGARVGISGASGSGKTSLLRLLSGLALPTEGTVCWGTTVLTQLSEQSRDAWRGSTIGFIFQDFRLFSSLSALDNVLVPATFLHIKVPPPLMERAQKLLRVMEIGQPHQRVQTLSRGEQQRVAVARALLLRPALLLADEPTASLDVDNARSVMGALLHYAETENATLCVVSHDQSVLERLPSRQHLHRGQLLPEQP